MNVTRIEYDDKTNTYAFYFNDGILLRVILSNRWIYREIEIEYLKFNKTNLDYDLQQYYQYDSKGKVRLGFVDKDKLINSKIMSYWYYILTNVMTFIRYYPSTGEWIDPYKPCYEKHELMDVKHKLHNLRKASTINWGHYDILRNIEQYNEYCKVSRFARESLLNFYSRFLKLSILKNNKALGWIIDATDSFLNYGLVTPDENLITKCVAPKQKEFGCMFCGGGEITVDVFSSVSSVVADSFESHTETKTCPYQEPHPTDDVKWCKYVQFYYQKMKWNRRVGVRQQTSEIVKMQLTDTLFIWNGKCSYSVYNVYMDRITVKSTTLSAFEQLIGRLFVQHQYLDGVMQGNPDGSMLIAVAPPGKIVVKYSISEPNISYLVRFLILNKSSLGTFIMKSILDRSHIESLLKISNSHVECRTGKLTRLRDLILKRKLLES